MRRVLFGIAAALAFLPGPVAVADDFVCTEVLGVLTPRGQGTPQTIERRYLEVWRKDAGRWRVIRTMDNAG